MIKNLEKINSKKRKKIKKGCEFIERVNFDNIIEKVIVFGSSVTEDCSEDSDIDICLVSKYNSSNKTFFQIFGEFPLVLDDDCDILIYNRLSGKIKDEIDKKGVVVYEYT